MVFADSVESHAVISSLDVFDNNHFYPPGEIIHIVSVPSPESSNADAEEHVGIYQTPRELYSKLQLSRTMINDHYMPMYKKMKDICGE